MSEPTDDEYLDWKDLLASPGWARLKDQAKRMHSAETFEGHVINALNGVDATAIGKLRQMVAAKQAVMWLLSYPEQCALHLKPRGEPEPHMGRRGAL